MSIKTIHGFLKEDQEAKPEYGNISITEIVLVETTSPTVNVVAMLTALPAFPASPSVDNPKGISFTFDKSTHPDAPNLTLRSAGTIKQVGGCFWMIPLTYAIFNSSEISGGFASGGGGAGNNNPRQRKDQREYIDPMERPVVWTSSSSLVQKETYINRVTGLAIVQTNGLPITSPIKFSEAHSTHVFSFNVEYSDFIFAFYETYIGTVSSGGGLSRPNGEMKVVAASFSEEFESNGTGVGKTDYHYVRVSVSFEHNPGNWVTEAKLVSMSTMQLALTPGPFPILFYDKIKISDTQYAEEPWPLLPGGAAVPYDLNDPTTYGYIDHGFPIKKDFAPLIAKPPSGSMAIPS